MKTRRGMKGLYVVKSEDDKPSELEPKKRSGSRGVYVIRTSDEIVNKFADTIYDFVDDGGLFLWVGNDKAFYQSLKRSIVIEFGLGTDFVQLFHEPNQILTKLIEVVDEGFLPFVFMENATNGSSNIQVLAAIKSAFPKIHIVVVCRELDKNHLLYCYEEGASHIINKCASVNEIIRKIAHILKPQTEIDELAEIGQKLNGDNRFEEAIRVADTMLTKHPKSARAHIIKGDAYKGLARRKIALAEYQQAEKKSRLFIEPLKKIFVIHAEEGNKDMMLDYLMKLDDMSPLNFNRKVKIGDLSYDLGKLEEAERYYDNAIEYAVSEAKSIVGELSLDIAEKIAQANPVLAAKYYKKSLNLVKESRGLECIEIFNRLGISLRKAGLWEEAVEAYEIAENMSPGDENIQYNIGLAYLDGKKFPKATNHMLMALKINPKMYIGNADIAYNMAITFKESGNKAQADKMIRHVFEVDPGHEGAHALA